MTTKQFFDCVDDVLVASGRERLQADELRRAIIEVRDSDRVLQILAGPGSGKTEVIVWRVLHELFVRGTPSSRMLVTTFTRKAALELETRLVERSDLFVEAARKRRLDVQDPLVHDLRLGTIHSLCDSLLAEFDTHYMESGTEVIDEMEAVVRLARDHRWALRNCATRLSENEDLVALFRAPWDDGRWPSRVMERADYILALLSQHTETWIPRCAASGTPNGVEFVRKHPNLTNDLVTLQERWETYLADKGVVDFATLQKRFLDAQDVLYDEIDHVFVDEFQDTNPIQFAIHVNWLNSLATRLTVVGDDDQSVYRFRGSDIGCFAQLEASCAADNLPFRLEKLERNYRSTKSIIAFSEAFRTRTVLNTVSMPKQIKPPRAAKKGRPVRLLEGPWPDVCAEIASEINRLGTGRIPLPGHAPAPSVAVLLFSTSERTGRRGNAPALDLRLELENRGLRVYNPRNKTAAASNSPVFELLALISYLIDPVSLQPIGRNGRAIEVWASCGDDAKAAHAVTTPPTFRVSHSHAAMQKKFRKDHGSILAPGPAIADLVTYVDQIRANLVGAVEQAKAGRGRGPRLTLAGFVARLLTLPRYRNAGFTRELFREALFTRLVEAQVAATRLTNNSLDSALEPERGSDGRIVWPARFWSLLNYFGALLDNTPLDDIDVDSFGEHAVGILTFHQAKGLEFDHVYVGLTGREAAPNAVLRTKLFSGQRVRYKLVNGQPHTTNAEVHVLSAADREREIYVAMTRARERLTFLHAPGDGRPLTGLNEGLDQLFAGHSRRTVRQRSLVQAVEFV